MLRKHSTHHPAQVALTLAVIQMSDEQLRAAVDALRWCSANKPSPASFKLALDELRLTVQAIEEA